MTLNRLVPASLLAATALALTAWACGGGNENLPPPPPPPPPPVEVDAAPPPPTASPTSTAAPTPAAPPVTLTPGAPAPAPKPMPTVKITAPKKNQVISAAKAKTFDVKLDVKNWKTAVGSSHVHLILDNKPYKAVYDTKKPVKLSELAGGEALAEGRHVLVAFPSRSTHESVKGKAALAIVPFWVGKKGDVKNDPTTKPMLIYSRPKGDYNGEMANHVLVDFQLANDTLGPQKDHVNITVTGPGIKKPLAAKVESFGTPYYLDNLQNGTYTLKLDLVDAKGKPVAGPWNSTTRSIKVDHDAEPTMKMQHDAGAPDAGAKKKSATTKKAPAKKAAAPKKK